MGYKLKTACEPLLPPLAGCEAAGHALAMSRRRKVALAVCAMLAAVVLLWPRDQGPTYEGKTVAEWFEQYCQHAWSKDEAGMKARRQADTALRTLGTNAVPYLAGHLNREARLTRAERWQLKIRSFLPAPLQPLIRPPPNTPALYAHAGDVLANSIQPPADILIPWIKPALESTNLMQQWHAITSLRGVSSGRDQAMPYVIRALQHADPLIQDGACAVVIHFRKDAKSAAPYLVPSITNRLGMTAMHAGEALGALGDDAIPVLPDLKRMLVTEPDPANRQRIEAVIKRLETEAATSVRQQAP